MTLEDHTAAGARDGWARVVALMDDVAADAAALDAAVAEVQASVPDVAALEAADVARHSRALMAAGMRAIGERRGPLTAELDFVAELAVTRARQGVPIESVLRGIHVAQQALWRRARGLAAERALDPGLLLDAAELYAEWAQEVQGALIRSHRRTELELAGSERDRRAALLRRLLEGGPRAGEIAARIGLDPAARYWCLRVRIESEDGAGGLERWLESGGGGVVGRLDDDLVAVVAGLPVAPAPELPIGAAGPAGAPALPAAAALAARVRAAAAELGRRGVARPEDVAFALAIAAEEEAGAALERVWLAGLPPDDEFAGALIETVLAWLEHGQQAGPAAAALFVHPNTVRYRLERFEQLTGRRPEGMIEAIHLYWAAWRRRRRAGADRGAGQRE